MEDILLVSAISGMVLCGITGAMMLSRFNKSPAGCLLGGLLGPIGLAIAWVMRDNAKLDGEGGTHVGASRSVAVGKNAPVAALGSWVPPWETEARPSAATTAASASRVERDCPYCAERILAKARVCKHCGREVEPVAT